MASLRCVSIGCWSMTAVPFGKVPLCEEHRAELAALLTPEPIDRSVVYYVTWANTDCVKIGTSTNVAQRVRSLGRGLAGARQPARLLRTEPGSYYLEMKRHREWAHIRKPSCIHGSECFRYTDALGDFMRTLPKPTPRAA